MSPRAAILPLLAALAIARFWVMPLPSSFWVDEMGTAFVVRHGAAHPSFAVAPQVPQSIYYALPRASQALFGFSEVSYRLPSLLAMLAALWFIAKLAARLIHPEAAWFAAFACFALRGISYQAADARPYGLGTLVASAALWFLVRWLDIGRRRDAALFLVAGALLWRVQLIFCPFYLVFAVYLAARRRDVRWKQAGVVFGLMAVALAPVLVEALRLFGEARLHAVAALPGARDVAASLKLGLPLVLGACAFLARRMFHWRERTPFPEGRNVALILAWWLAQPLGLFAFSWLTGASVFLPRYLWLALPGAVMAATLAASRFIPPHAWRTAAAALALGTLAWYGDWSHPWPLHHNSDWRAAAHAVEELARDAETPVICPSPFFEARPPVWRPDYALPGFLYAHLDVYGIPGKLYLFPFETSPEAEAYAAQLARGALQAAGRFAIYGNVGQAGFWREWFATRPELRRWEITRLGPFADVEVVLFRHPTLVATDLACRKSNR